jgi:hypothetical protein
MKILRLLPLVLLLAGCKIEFFGNSQVNDRGDIERTTIYRAESFSDKEELTARYGLPTTGAWTEEKKTVAGKEKIEYVYQITRTFALKEQPASDYMRFNESRTRFAKNNFEVKIKDRWVMKWYEYRERFEDVRDSQVGQDILKELLETSSQSFRGVLEPGFSKKEADALTQELTAYYQKILDRFLAALFKANAKTQLDSAFWDNLENDISTGQAKAALLARFPEITKTEAKVKTLDQALAAAQAAAEQFWNDEPRQNLLMESFGGVHGFRLLQSYPFTVALRMPGKVVSYNGTPEQGQILWKFNEEEFDKELFAVSRKLFPFRILIVLVLVALAAAAFNWKFKK